MLKTNDKYKADYITAINGKCKVAVARKRLRNKRIMCFSLAFLLVVGAISAAVFGKTKKVPNRDSDKDVLVNTSSQEEFEKTNSSAEKPPKEDIEESPKEAIIVYADTNFISRYEMSDEPTVGEITHFHDLEYEDGKLYHVYLDIYFAGAYYDPKDFSDIGYAQEEKYTCDFSISEESRALFAEEMNKKFDINNADDYIFVEEQMDGVNRFCFDHYKLRLDYIKDYCLKYWTEEEHGEALAELKIEGISKEWVEKYGYSGWQYYDSAWYYESGIYTEDGTALTDTMVEYFESLGIKQYLEPGCIAYNKDYEEFYIGKYIEKFGNEVNISHEGLRHIVYDYMHPNNQFEDEEHRATVKQWESEWSALFEKYHFNRPYLQTYRMFRYDMIVYGMLDEIGIECERNEYGYVILDIAKEDFDKLLTLPFACDVYLLEKDTTPEAIYEALTA